MISRVTVISVTPAAGGLNVRFNSPRGSGLLGQLAFSGVDPSCVLGGDLLVITHEGNVVKSVTVERTTVVYTPASD